MRLNCKRIRQPDSFEGPEHDGHGSYHQQSEMINLCVLLVSENDIVLIITSESILISCYIISNQDSTDSLFFSTPPLSKYVPQIFRIL